MIQRESLPLECLALPGSEPGPEMWMKREDLSPVKSYKWHGACSRMALFTPEQHDRYRSCRPLDEVST